MKRALIILALITAASAGGYYYFWGPQGAPSTAAGGPGGGPPGGFAIPVEATTVAIGTVVEAIPAVGSLRSTESVLIAPEIEGRISRLRVKEGKPVNAGTLLAELAPEIYVAELAQAQARLTYSKRSHERALKLQRQGAGTQRSLDEASANLQNDVAALQLAKARLDKTRIRAPFDGVLGLRRVSTGAYVKPGDPIINVEVIDPMKVDFKVPEIYLTAIRTGQKIDINVTALPGRSFTGNVYAIDPLVDVSGRSIVVRARVPNPNGLLKPGLFAQILLIVQKRESALLVPERTLVPIGSDQFVFKVVDGKAVRTKVKIGNREKGRVEIVSGLAKGDVVVTDGQIKIADGTPVHVSNQPGGPGKKPTSAGQTDSPASAKTPPKS